MKRIDAIGWSIATIGALIMHYCYGYSVAAGVLWAMTVGVIVSVIEWRVK